MLFCDDEPSPVSSDEVFFICEKQTNVELDDSNNVDNPDNDSDLKSDCESNAKNQKTTTNRMNRVRSKKTSPDDKTSTTLEVAKDQSLPQTLPHTENNQSKEAASQTAHTILVKIQVENCSQCPDKSISLYPNDKPITKNENTCKMKKKTVAVQVNFNSIESAVESHCVKISKVRCCNNKQALLNNASKGTNKCNAEITENSENKTADSTKIYLWNCGKSGKKKSSSLKSASSVEKVKPALKSTPTIQEPVQKSNNSVEKTSIKCKKPPIGCSPLKKLNRSSLTIEPDKITINLSKYSPCASRLAASSKIMSSNSPLSPDSPLHGYPRSPGRLEHVQSVDTAVNRQAEKATLQASLSLNIQQFQKTHPTPRSRSVGDSCVTSPTSEATTLSYSPTGTEILSLEEVGQGSYVHETNVAAAAAVGGAFMLPPTPELKDILNEEYSACALKANLETKC